MSLLSQWVTAAMRGAILPVTLCLFISDGAYAQSMASFGRLAGQWAGSGTIDLSNGTREPIKCRAVYDVLSEQKNLQLNLRCASESYNFDLRASANNSAGAISGTWSESTRNAAGTISGRAEGDRFQVMVKGPTFSASLTLVTRGDRQSVVIKSQDSQATIKGTSIALRRR